ncbi:MAG: HlyC/CorC family transporter [Clostridia bacterium]|nr:HlyC/CorC family transporter [Clostridia bacterium]
MLGAIFLQVFLIFLNAVFASAEIAVISVSDGKLEKLIEDGDKRAKRLLKLKGNSSKFLSTIQVAITLSGFLGSAYAADNFADPLVAWLMTLGLTVPEATVSSVCVLLITILLSFFSIVFGELVPKRIAMKHSEKMALALSGVLTFVSRAFAPFVWVLSKSTNGVLRLFGIRPEDEAEEVTEEDILLMLDSGSEQGNIDRMENEFIQNIFEFDDLSLSEVCTHRKNVKFLYMEESVAEWRDEINRSRHNYYPVCQKDADDILSVLNVSKFMRGTYKDTEAAILGAGEKPLFVPETMKADVLFTQMKKTRSYFAVVIDEYGGTSGVVTVVDLLELLVGDLRFRDEETVQEIRRLDDNRWEILGTALVKEVCDELDVEIDDSDYDTFGGYIFGLLGIVPDDGTQHTVETDELIIRVECIEDHRVERTTVEKKPKEEA